MRDRHAEPDALCGEEIEPATIVLRRAIARGRLRAVVQGAGLVPAEWWIRLGLPPVPPQRLAGARFEEIWAMASHGPRLDARRLRPSELPPEIDRADRALVALRRMASRRRSRAQSSAMSVS